MEDALTRWLQVAEAPKEVGTEAFDSDLEGTVAETTSPRNFFIIRLESLHKRSKDKHPGNLDPIISTTFLMTTLFLHIPSETN